MSHNNAPYGGVTYFEVTMMRMTLLCILLFVMGCSVQHGLYLDGEENLTLIVRGIDFGRSTDKGQFEIIADSPEYIALNSWLEENRSGWEQGQFKGLSPYVLYNSDTRIQFSDHSVLIIDSQYGATTMWRKDIDASLSEIFSKY